MGAAALEPRTRSSQSPSGGRGPSGAGGSAASGMAAAFAFGRRAPAGRGGALTLYGRARVRGRSAPHHGHPDIVYSRRPTTTKVPAVTQISERPADELVARIPPIVDLDAHVVEPADVLHQPAPGAEHRDVGPLHRLRPRPTRSCSMEPSARRRRALPGRGPTWRGGSTRTTALDKRPIAPRVPAGGGHHAGRHLRADAAPGCCQVSRPAWRTWSLNGVEASWALLPELPALRRPDLRLGAKDKELARLCVQAYNDWMVEEWCAGAGAGADPAVHRAAVGRRAGRRRGAPQRGAGRAGGGLQRDARSTSACLSIHIGYWEPVLRRPAPRLDTVVSMHIGSSSQTPAHSPDAPIAGVRSTLHLATTSMRARRLVLLRRAAPPPPPEAHRTSRARSAGSRTCSSGCDDVRQTHAGACDAHRGRAESRRSYYYRRQVLGCFFRDHRRPRALERGRRRQRHLRDRLPLGTTTPRGRTPCAQAAAEQFGHLDQEIIDKLACNNGIRLPGLRPAPRGGGGDRTGSGADRRLGYRRRPPARRTNGEGNG